MNTLSALQAIEPALALLDPVGLLTSVRFRDLGSSAPAPVFCAQPEQAHRAAEVQRQG